MSKYQTAVTENGLQFLVTRANGKVEALSGDFAFVAPMEPDKALDALKHEVSQRGNVTRAALTALYAILQSSTIAWAKGEGDINADAGIPKEVKTSLRTAEEAYFTPMFKDEKKKAQFLTSIRDAGIYATVKGIALKYFYFVGKLPCLYEGDHPHPGKLLSVSAMQKLMANMQEDKVQKDESIAAKVLQLHGEFSDAENLTRGQLAVILSNLSKFADDVKQAINTIDAHATANPDKLPGAMSADEMAQAISQAWAKREEEEAIEEA